MIAAADLRFVHLGIEIDHMRNSFSIFGFDIAFYGCILGLGIVAGALLVFREAKRTGQSVDMYLDFAIAAVIFSIIGARLYYVIFEWSYYREHLLEIFNLRAGGLAIYGAIIGAVLTLLVFSKVRKVSFFKMADTGCIGLILGQAIGRWGNFVNCEAFGGYTDGLFAMQIKKSLVAASNITPDIQAHIVNLDGVEYIQVHPTFLYESLWCLAVLALLLLYRKHKKFQGELTLLYFICYGLGRAWIEGLRTDQLLVWGTQIPVSQALSGCLVVLCGGILIWKRLSLKKAAKKPKEEENRQE